MPAPTVTLYTLLAMGATVMPALFFTSFVATPKVEGWAALLGLTTLTFLSRLTLFMGVKHLGGVQTALLGVGELLITIFFSHLLLGEHLTLFQWMGVLLLVASLTMSILEKPQQRRSVTGGWLSWLRPPGIPQDMTWPHD